MEWQGINLSLTRQNFWLKETKKNIGYMMISIIVSFVIGLLAIFSYQEKKIIYQNDLNKYQHIQQEIENIEGRIEQIKQNVRKGDVEFIDNKIVERFLLYITQFQVSGVIETIQLYRDGEIICKIIGKLHHQSEFQHIEQQLKETNLEYQVEQYQTNEKQQIEFTLLIKLGE